jgi:hypothetical protein
MPEKWLQGNTIIIGTTKSVILFYVFKLQTRKHKESFLKFNINFWTWTISLTLADATAGMNCVWQLEHVMRGV